MVDTSRIRNGLAVIASDGEPVGAVDTLEGDRIKLTRKDSTDNEHHYIPLAWVERVEERVHLNRTGAEVRTAWGRFTGATPGGRGGATTGARRTNWLPWVLIALGLLALLWALSRCDRDGEATTATTTTTTETTAPATTEPATTPPPETGE